MAVRKKPATRKKTGAVKAGPKTTGKSANKAASKTGKPVPRTIKARASTRRLENDFYVAGIGASAGGLEALEEFFSNLPSNSGVAFVLITHLDPTRKSILNDLLKKYTEMGVYQAKDGTEVRPDNVYVIPPNKDMAIMNGRLQLMEPQMRHGMRHPIDFFFRSLAEDMKEKAICIVLSGGGTDGTLGLKAIKGEGGMAMVQSIESSKYDGMPRSAIDTGLADFMLAPKQMPEPLMKYVKFSYIAHAKEPPPLMLKISENLEKILFLIRSQTGHDFSYYKENTIIRRVERRMNVHQIAKVPDYIRFLQDNSSESELLFRELLIGVTNFFRDHDAFETLKLKILPEMLQNWPSGKPFRVWVPGCATGEEAYSIAMMLREYTERIKRDIKVQIFATDINAEAIDKARAGIYPESIVSDVSQDRLNRFFLKGDNTYQVKKEVKEMVVFALQNLIKDPPFSRLNIVSCRNLLIYLQPQMQKKLLPLFHFVLNPGGILFLGPSESSGTFSDLFTTVDKKWRIYQRTNVAPSRLVELRMPIFPIRGITEAQRTGNVPTREESIGEAVERVLLAKYTPPSAIINEKNNIVYIHGQTGRFLEPAPGEARMNIIEMAKEGLKAELLAAIRRAQTKKDEVERRDVQVRHNGDYLTVNVRVKPLEPAERMKGLLMVMFEDVTRLVSTGGDEPKAAVKSKRRKGESADARVLELERELQATKEYLQTTIEELETSNEELQSTNEELNASNEELQSTNEELESSKEELQSVNEELITVNSEMQNKNEELSHANNDLNNLLLSTRIGTVFLDKNLRIKRFTPEVSEIVNLIQSDIGRPFSQISLNLKGVDLLKDVKEVLRTLAYVEKEVESSEGKWFLMRVLPYRTTENVIEGAVMTFTGIDRMKKAEEKVKESEQMLSAISESSMDAIIMVDADGKVTYWNPAAVKIFGYAKEEALRRRLHDFMVSEEAKMEYMRLLPGFLATGECPVVGKPKMLSATRKDGTVIPVELSVVSVMIKGKWHAVGTVRDLSEREESP